MADEVARLVAVMEAQLRGFTKGMEQAQAEADRRFGAIERRMNQTEKRFSNSFKDLTGFATRIGGALGIAFSVEGLINFGKQVLISTAQLSEQAQQAQVGVEALQAYRIAFKEAGSSAETADRALGLLNKTLGEAQEGSTSAREEFQRLHLSFQDVANAKPDERLALVAKALLDMKNGANRAALETQFFGRSGREIESVLAKLATGVHALTTEYKDHGRIITDELAKKTDDAMDRIAAAFDRGRVASVPFFASIAVGVADFLDDLQRLPQRMDVLIDEFKEAQTLANRLKGQSFPTFPRSSVDIDVGRAGRAQAIADAKAQEIIARRNATLPFLAPESFQPKLGVDASSIGVLDKFFAKMQLIASLSGEIPSERAKDEKLIEAATAKLEQEGRSNLKLLRSMEDVNQVLNEQVGLRDKILKIIEEQNAAEAKAKFTERLETARRFQQVGATTIKAPEIPKVKADEEQFKRVSEEFGTDAATALDRRLHGDQAIVPDVTITPRNANTPRVAEPIPALDQAAKENAQQIAQQSIDALEEREKRLNRIQSAEQTVIDELTEESKIAGLLPRQREEEIELLRIKERFGSDFAEQHDAEFRQLIRNKQAAEDFASVESAAVEGLADIGASALTGSRNVQQAFADMLRSLAAYIIKLELAKALEASLGDTGGGGGGGILNVIGKLLGIGGGGGGGFLGTIGGFQAGGLTVPDVVITPRLAGGGPVSANKPYVVGETGRELFVPDVSGVIIPHKKTEEIIKTQETRASGGPVSTGKPYIVGETGRELFIPSTSGFVYPKPPDGDGGIGIRREAGRPVSAGQPIVVGDVGVEVFVPDFPEQPQPLVNVAAPSISTAQYQTDNRQTETSTAHTNITREHQQELFADVADHVEPLQSPLRATTQAPSLDGRRSNLSPDVRANERAHEPLPQSPQHDRSHIASVSHTYIVGEHGQELFIPNVAGFIYPKVPPEKGVRDIARVLSAGQPIIIGQRGEEIFAPYISDVSHEATNISGDTSTHVAATSTNDNRSVSQDVNQSRFSHEVHPEHHEVHSSVSSADRTSSISDATTVILRRDSAHSHADNRTQTDNRISNAIHRSDIALTHEYARDISSDAPGGHRTSIDRRSTNGPSFSYANDSHFNEWRHEPGIYPETTISLRRERLPERSEHLTIRDTASSNLQSTDRFVEQNNLSSDAIRVEASKIQSARTADRSSQTTDRSEIRKEHDARREYRSEASRHNETVSTQAPAAPEAFSGSAMSEYLASAIEAHEASPRASGGPVSRGYMYVVGEHGREMFSPASMGNQEPEIKSFALGGILGGLLGGFGGQSSSLGAFGLLKLLGLGGGGTLGLASKAGIPNSFDLLDWLKNQFAEGGVMGPHGQIPLKQFGFGGILGGLLGGFGGQSGNLGAFGVLKMLGLGGIGSGLFGYSQKQGLGAFGAVDWLRDQFAQGGIMGPHGQIPLRSFQSGGIANSPQLALFGEGSGPEAFVPLQDGKIPVRLQIPNISVPASASGSSNNSIYVDARGAQVGVAEQIQQALTRAFPTFVGAAVSTVDKNFPSMFRRAHRDRL